jgi:hypothetical protein
MDISNYKLSTLTEVIVVDPIPNFAIGNSVIDRWQAFLSAHLHIFPVETV